MHGNTLAGGVLFVRSACRPLLLANRCPNLRAVSTHRADALDRAIAELSPNVLILEYPRLSGEMLASLVEKVLSHTPAPPRRSQPRAPRTLPPHVTPPRTGAHAPTPEPPRKSPTPGNPDPEPRTPMRIARIIGNVTLSHRLPGLRAGTLLLAEPLDGDAVRSPGASARRSSPAPESLVVFDELGAGEGQLIAVSEGREATMPFYPGKVPIDAYAAAIIDTVHIDEKKPQGHRSQAASLNPGDNHWKLTMTPTVNEWAIRQQICDIGKRIWQKSFCAGNEGNHSVKVADNRYLCTPTGISKGFLEPEDVIVCDAEGQQIEPNARGRKPTSEIKVHLAIYKVRSDVGAVIHSHPPHATAFAIAGIPLPEAVHPEAEVFFGKVRTAQFAMPSTHDLPQSLLPLIGPETNSLLMGNHGSVSFAPISSTPTTSSRSSTPTAACCCWCTSSAGSTCSTRTR